MATWSFSVAILRCVRPMMGDLLSQKHRHDRCACTKACSPALWSTSPWKEDRPMNNTPTSTAHPTRWTTRSLACWMAFLCCASAWAAQPNPSPKKRAPNPAYNAVPHVNPDSELDGKERFLLLSADGISVTQTAFASAKQCEAERKRTLRRNPRLARYLAQGEVDFECVADDAGSELPYEASIIDKSTGLRVDLSMRTQAQCEIGMSHAKAAGRRYTIQSMCHQRPWGQALNRGSDGSLFPSVQACHQTFAAENSRMSARRGSSTAVGTTPSRWAPI